MTPIPIKTNRILNFILFAFLLILVRVWYLTVVQYDTHVEQAHQPQRRTQKEFVERGSIRDRFGIPLASNKLQFNAAVCYSQIREIPRVSWKKDEQGKSSRFFARNEYITSLSSLLAKELEMDPIDIEDIIHGKASLFPHLSFTIKEGISEKQYYRLKMLEKDWRGIQTERASKRFYNKGKVGCDIVGHMGAINQQEYSKLTEEIKELQSYLSKREIGEISSLPKGFDSPLEVRERLRQLQESSYTIQDFIGKAGIEAAYDEQLRGTIGRKIFEVDIKGNFLRELPGSRRSISGQRIILTISSELQEFAETLLTEVEIDHFKENGLSHSAPWIKGGAIVAMDPKTGDILALASYPRIDPNDFITENRKDLKETKQSSLIKWLENQTYIAELWDGKRPIEKEIFSPTLKNFEEKAFFLDWQTYTQMILSESSPIHAALNKISDLKTAYLFQQLLEDFLKLSCQSNPLVLLEAIYEKGHIASRTSIPQIEKRAAQESLKKDEELYQELKFKLDFFLSSIPHQDDKLLLIDLCRLVVKKERFSTQLLSEVGDQSISSYRLFCQAVSSFEKFLAQQVRHLYHNLTFSEWRELNSKTFIKEKRAEEKAKKQYARPYIDYLEAAEKQMFKEFWKKYRSELIQAFILEDYTPSLFENSALIPYLEYVVKLPSKFFQQEKRVGIVYRDDLHKFKNLLHTLGPNLSSAYLQTVQSFEELNEPLSGFYRNLRNHQGKQLQKHLAAAFYPLNGFGYGRSQAFRQSTPQGSPFKLMVAYEALKETYENSYSATPSFATLNPLTLIDDLTWHPKVGSPSQILGYTLEGTPIKRLYKDGRLPKSSHAHIGKIDLIGAIEQSSNIYFSILALDHIHSPNHLVNSARLFGFGEKTGVELPGEIPGSIPEDLDYNRTGLYSFAIGQHSLIGTPLQTAVMLSALANGGSVLKPKVIQAIIGKELALETEKLFSLSHFPFQKDLLLTGIAFPLFTQVVPHTELPYIYYPKTQVRRSIFLPTQIRTTLLEGMHRVMNGDKGTARLSVIRDLNLPSKVFQDYVDIHGQMVGKTGTAEILYKPTLDTQAVPTLINHIWFGGISFNPSQTRWSDPELVVVVYLRFGHFGKEAAPLATRMVKKWREIQAKQKVGSKG